MIGTVLEKDAARGVLLKRVLVIDDEPSVLELLRDILAYEYEVEAMTDPVAGLECAVGEDFDLLIVDLGMPQMSGIELIQRLTGAREGKTMPIIVVSAVDGLRSEATELPVAAVIAKPFSIDKLLATVAKVLPD